MIIAGSSRLGFDHSRGRFPRTLCADESSLTSAGRRHAAAPCHLVATPGAFAGLDFDSGRRDTQIVRMQTFSPSLGRTLPLAGQVRPFLVVRPLAAALLLAALAFVAEAEAQPTALFPQGQAPRPVGAEAPPSPQASPVAEAPPAPAQPPDEPADPPAAGVLPGSVDTGREAAAGDAAEIDEEPRAPVLVGDILGEMREYYTWTSDTLLDIARGEDLGLINLMSANPGVDPWLPGRGTRIVLPTAHILPDAPRRGVVINIAELRLYLYAENGSVWSFSIGVGRDGFSTPLGQTKVVRKKENPTWYPTAAKRAEDPEVPAVVPPGPDNPMGEHALYLGWPTYAVHGTNQPWAVGRRVTRGCIRLYPEDIAWVFRQAPVGTPVTVVDQPVKLGRRNGEIFIEVHPSLKQVDQIEEKGRADPDPLTDQTDTILAFAGDAIPRLDWEVINQALAERRGYPIQITKPSS